MANVISVPYFTVAEAAEQLGVSEIRVRQFCQEGRLGQKVGSIWLIARGELFAFKRKKRHPGPPRKK